MWRGGYQISYDAFFTQMIFLGPATSTPNAISTSTIAPNAGRGSPNWFEQLPAAAAAPHLLDSQSAIDKDLRSPYTERWSVGFQRQLPQKVLLDVSYVGSESHKLTTKTDFNPRLLDGLPLIQTLDCGRFVRARGTRSIMPCKAGGSTVRERIPTDGIVYVVQISRQHK